MNYVQSKVEDFISAEQVVQRVVKALLAKSVTFIEVFMKECIKEGIIDVFLRALKDHEPFKVLLKS